MFANVFLKTVLCSGFWWGFFSWKQFLGRHVWYFDMQGNKPWFCFDFFSIVLVLQQNQSVFIFELQIYLYAFFLSPSWPTDRMKLTGQGIWEGKTWDWLWLWTTGLSFSQGTSSRLPGIWYPLWFRCAQPWAWTSGSLPCKQDYACWSTCDDQALCPAGPAKTLA